MKPTSPPLGAVNFYPLFSAQSVEQFALYHWLPDEPEWEIVAARASHELTLESLEREYGIEQCDLCRSIPKNGSRQIVAVTLQNHDWTFMLYSMGEFNERGIARVRRHSQAISARLGNEVIALVGASFYVYIDGRFCPSKCGYFSPAEAVEEEEEQRLYVGAVGFLQARKMIVPVMDVDKMGAFVSFGLFGLGPDQVERVTLVTMKSGW